jgi:ABC-type glycerol-3-phosphate transport system permease component
MVRGPFTFARVAGLVGQLLLLAWLVIVAVPLIAALISSVKNSKDILTNPLGLDFSNIRWGNFAEALQGTTGGRPLWDYLGNSVVATVLSIILGVSLSILAAYGLARAGDRFGFIMNRTFTILLTIPILATLVPLFDFMGAIGLSNNVFGISLVYAAFMVPPTTLLMRPYFAAIPVELTEAAKIDGASEFRTFLQVVLPIAFPTILGVIVINVISIWSELAIASTLLVTPESKTLPVGLLAFKGEYSTNLGVQAAGLLLASAPLLILYFIFSRRVTDGMQAGVFK